MGELRTFHPSYNFVPTMISDLLKELPSILDAAVGALKEEAKCPDSLSIGEPILAEFIPSRKSSEESGGWKLKNPKDGDLKDKQNWMTSVQLWNADHHQNQSEKDEGKAIVPFKGNGHGTVASRKESEEVREEQSSSGPGSASVPFMRMVSSGRLISVSAPPNSRSARWHEPPRKQRRCWAPELHRLFVSTLEKLGGPRAATPKLIRELMQVDGLTNDEVKSHLQKYRLHTRRPPNIKGSSSSNQSVVLRDVWMPREGRAIRSQDLPRVLSS
ncbi:hypothetical protein CRG98_040336 [Punica granatum]|uniref:HTH myb-type domain-containing protein n=1 Tax=Punica granatum TaxID=22663 RepID=A0A2I0I6I1_PUNGR|nr:hypothetical protein CRG98_040336 [Punica granatum]